MLRAILSERSKFIAIGFDTNPRCDHGRHARTNRSTFFPSPLEFLDKSDNVVHAERIAFVTSAYPCEPEAKHERTNRGELAPCTEPNQQDSSSATLPSKLEESSIFVSLHIGIMLLRIYYIHITAT